MVASKIFSQLILCCLIFAGFSLGGCDFVGMQMKNDASGGNLSPGDGEALSVVSVTPAVGVTAGGTRIMVKGTGFTPDSVVELDRNECQDLEYISSESLRCVTPENLAGTVSVSVWVGGTSATLDSGFQYVSDQGGGPGSVSITGVTPSTGNVAGGQRIQISGTGFKQGATVMIDNYACVNPVITSTSITCATPPNVKRKAEVRVTNPDQQDIAILPDGFQYNAGTITYNILYKVIFFGQCIGCHANGGQDGVSLNTYNNAKMSIDLGTPTNSRLYKAVKSNADGVAEMPVGDALVPEEQDAILQWIQAGAPN